MRTIWTLMATIWGMVVPTCSAIFSFQTLSPHLLFHVVGHAGSDFVEFCSACCVIICHISQHHQNRRWCIFFKSIYFLTLIGLNNALVAKLTHMRHVSDQTRAVYLNLFFTEYTLNTFTSVKPFLNRTQTQRQKWYNHLSDSADLSNKPSTRVRVSIGWNKLQIQSK